jgi:signal transduction histidine kinase
MATAQLPREDSRAPVRLGEPALPLHWARPSLWLLGALFGAAILGLTIASGEQTFEVEMLLSVLLGWSFVASGLIAWRHRPEDRIGPIMVTVGFVWLLSRLMSLADWAPVYTTAIWISDLWVVVYVLFLVSFPHGRLSPRNYALLAPFVLAVVPLELLWFLFLDLGEDRNALLVWPNEDVASQVDWAQRVIIVSATVVVTLVLARRWLLATPPVRRALTPIFAGAAAFLLGASLTMLAKVAEPPRALQWVVLVATALVPLAVLAGLLRARLARSAVGDLMVELRGQPTPGELRNALARALHDPSVEIAYWVPEYELYVGPDGRPLQLPADGDGRAVTVVEQGGRTVAALVHDASLRDESELVAAVTAAAGIALENERLQADLRARLEELRGSRARIVEAGDAERRRLERNLHDGAQQRLVSVSVGLNLLASRVERGSDAAELLANAREELAASLEELRTLAQGIHPAVLTDHGLEVALETLAAHASLPVRLEVDVDGRLPEAVEVAAYYLVSEALTNTAKYAKATSASVQASRHDDRLVIDIGDDGVGGADPARGTGLRGLADRVEALDGRLRVWSPSGGGTRVRAEIPCA